MGISTITTPPPPRGADSDYREHGNFVVRRDVTWRRQRHRLHAIGGHLAHRQGTSRPLGPLPTLYPALQG